MGGEQSDFWNGAGGEARIGAIGQALVDADDATRAEVLEVVRAAYQPFVTRGEVRFTARCWSVGAENAG
jgi:hypothetical protein